MLTTCLSWILLFCLTLPSISCMAACFGELLSSCHYFLQQCNVFVRSLSALTYIRPFCLTILSVSCMFLVICLTHPKQNVLDVAEFWWMTSAMACLSGWNHDTLMGNTGFDICIVYIRSYPHAVKKSQKNTKSPTMQSACCNSAGQTHSSHKHDEATVSTLHQ